MSSRATASLALLIAALTPATAFSGERPALPDLPYGITSFGAATTGGKLYVCGGNKGGAHRYWKAGQNERFLALDLERPQKWQHLGDVPRRQGLAMVAHGGKLYRIGGFEARNAEDEEQDLHSTADFVRYDPKTAKWQKLADLPRPRSSHDAVVMGDKLYVVGGWDMQGEEKHWQETALVADLTAEPIAWKEFAAPFRRRALSVGEQDGRLYVVGGMQEEGGPTGKTSVYDPAAGKWSDGPDLVTEGRIKGFGSSAFARGGRLYASLYDGSVQRLSADASQWEVVGRLEHPRFFHRMVPAGPNRLAVVGGASMETGKVLETELVVTSAAGTTRKPAASGAGEATSRVRPRWPGFQGPASNVDPQAIPVEWSPEKNVAWRASVPGYGQSSPVVWGDRVYLTSVSGANKEQCHVTAWSLETGEKLWQHDLEAATKRENTFYVSKAAPTPVVDAAGLIAFFEGGNLVALTHDGSVRWQRNLVQEFGPVSSRHGLSSSLVQTDETVFVWVERSDEPYLLAVDKQTGEDRWKADGLGVTTWSTPALIPVAGGRHLVLSGIGKLAGLDPRTGERLWTLEEVVGNSTPTPQPFGTGRFLLGATVSERRGGGGAPSNGVVAVEKSEDGTWSARFVWKTRSASSSFGSPIVHDGLAYFVNKSGVLFCLEAETGEPVYTERVAESCWATPLVVGERIYLVGKTGKTTVVRAGREFEQLAENQLWTADSVQPKPGVPPQFAAPVQYAVVAAGKSLLIRRGDVLYCLRQNG